MEKLWTVPELMDRYGWAEDATMRRIRKEMRHIGKGKNMRVPESALREWEMIHLQEAQDTIRESSTRKGKKKGPALKVMAGGKAAQGKHMVPRTRAEALRQLGYG